MDRRSICYLFATLVGAWIPVLLDAQAVSSAAALWPLAESPNPYFVPDEAALLYFRAPLVIVSAFILCLSPGLLLALAMPSSSSVERWVLNSFALSLLVVSSVAAFVQELSASPLQGGTFLAVPIACSTTSFGVLLWRVANRDAVAWPMRNPHAPETLLLMVAAPWILMVVLAPKFYWEAFNGDGVQALEVGRLLLWRPLPFWDQGEMRFPGVTTMLAAFPASWFIRTFGEIEVAARVPFALYLGLLYAGALALLEKKRSGPLGMPERLLVWLGLGLYVEVMAYNATWDPYSADLASPSAYDALLMVCFFGFLLGFLRNEHIFMSLWLVLAYLTRPNGAFLIALWIFFVVLVFRRRPWPQIGTSIAILFACFLATRFAPEALAAVGLPGPGLEHNWRHMLQRYLVAQSSEWLQAGFLWEPDHLRRWIFLILPTGILPAVALFAWRRQDRWTRSLALVSLTYFAFFYIQSVVALHYFSPIMLMPMVVYWRTDLPGVRRHRRWTLAATTIALLLALFLSFPKNLHVVTEPRVIGGAIEERIGGYERMEAGLWGRVNIFRHLVPWDSNPRVPEEIYGGEPLTWNYYAHRSEGSPREVNYVLQSSSDPAPPGMLLLASENGAALYVADPAALGRHRSLHPPSPAGTPLYSIPRELLFPYQHGR